MNTNATGLFMVSYQIDTGFLGSPCLKVGLTVCTPSETVNGVGNLSNNSIHPAFNMNSKIEGSYTYMTVMPNNSHILVTATGYPVVQWPSGGGVGPVLTPNLKLQIVLDSNWQGGTANYKYCNEQGEWVSIQNATVTAVNMSQFASAA